MLLSLRPDADPSAMVTAGNARFTVLTPALIRLEWSPSAAFADRPSFVFLNRRLSVPEFSVDRSRGVLTLTTGELTLRYREKGGRFSKSNLAVEFHLNGEKRTWVPGQKDRGNLGGTVRTLDSVDGPARIEPGLLSRDGWVVVDDSNGLLFDSPAGPGLHPWAVRRPPGPAIDWYFFGYGHDYAGTLRDYVNLAGRIPLPPKFVFGSWWSRYWDYTDQEFRDLVREYRAHDVPLDVLVIDMDWHLDGWTGYTWNPKYFPDPNGFLDWCRSEGLRTTLNLHPADGVGKHEDRFPEMAQAMGLDPSRADSVPFDIADPKFSDAYFKVLHHPLERQGVDFWWIDWQQGETTAMEGLDPLWWLNHLHWTDMERNPDPEARRPLILSRWGGLGNHRYPLGFSGDTYSSWRSLAFQPHFTATAGNVGYPYWSHDIGGHQPGPVEPEMYVRWIQWGIFSPVLRTHGTKNAAAERRIWKLPPEMFKIARQAFHFRYELIPYIYTAARQCYDDGTPLCRPLYHAWPELPAAYRNPGEFLFGDQLLIAPVATPMNRLTRCAETRVWIPPGEWIHWYTGATYTGPAEFTIPVPMHEIPVFVRSGGVIATMPKMRNTKERPVDPLIFHIFPGDAGAARVYEDDGESAGYRNGQCAWTPVAFKNENGIRTIFVGPTKGSFAGMLKERQYEVRLREVWPVEEITVNGTKLDPAAWRYDSESFSVVIRLPRRRVTERTEIVIRSHPGFAHERLLREGLRGRVAVLNEVSGILGQKTPKEIRCAISGRRRLGPDRAAAQAQSIPVNWPVYISRVRQLKTNPDLKLQSLARLIGLTGQIRVKAVGRSGNIAVSVRASMEWPGADAKIEFTPPRRWRIVKGGREFAHEWTAHLSPKRGPQSEVLKANVIVGQNGVKIRFPLDVEIFPSVNAWWISTPFDVPFESSLNTVFSPETNARQHLRRKKLWKPVIRQIRGGTDLSKEFYVDLHKATGEHHNDAVAYAFTYLHARTATKAVLAVGSDDGVAAWVNGKEVHRNPARRAYVSKQDRVPIRLRKGRNTLLLKISQGDGEWGFCAHIDPAGAGGRPEVEARLTQ